MCSFAFVNILDFLELDIGHCDCPRPAAANTLRIIEANLMLVPCSLNPERRVSLLLRARLSEVEVIPHDMINVLSSAGRTPKDVSGQAGSYIDLCKPGGPSVVAWSLESW